MDDVVLARALHVLSVVHWIGGVAFVTLVALPLAKARGGAEGLDLFGAIERRFAAQVRLSIPIAGAFGLWIAYRMDLWYRFGDLHFWWMSAMAGLWLVFALMVFVLEPLLHPRFEAEGRRDPVAMLRRMSRVHAVLLTIAALTVLGAVVGAQGAVFLSERAFDFEMDASACLKSSNPLRKNRAQFLGGVAAGVRAGLAQMRTRPSRNT